VKLLSFSWDHQFKVLKEGPFPAILGLDFWDRAKMLVDVASRKYSFGFASGYSGTFSEWSEVCEAEPFLHNLCQEALNAATVSGVWPSGVNSKSIVAEFPAVFSSTLGTAKCTPYEIELSDPTPVRSPPYRCAAPKLAIFRKMVDDLLEKGVVRTNKSPYTSPAFLVPKSGGDYRMVVHYRKVNAKVVFDSYPMPTIEQAFEQFGGAVVFLVLDLNSAYYQIPVSYKSRRVTAFCTPFGLFEFNKLPMGISIGCQGLSRVIDELFVDLKGQYVFNFLDDLVVYSSTVKEHVGHVWEVLGRLQRAGFTLNPEKVTLGATEIKYLGHLLSPRGIRILPDRVSAIQEYPRPANLRALRRFIGMVGFYGCFIPQYVEVAAVLYGLKKEEVPFVWRAEHQTAFDRLKQALCEAPVLQVPDFGKEFVLVTDASDLAISAVLQQQISGGLAPISYYSRVLTEAEKKYSTYKKECLAVIFGCEKCRAYLEHREFEVHCDNLALCWLLKRVKDVGRLGRWILRLAPFKFRVKHMRGVDNVVADALSRVFEGACAEAPEMACATLLESLPLVYSSLEEHQKEDSLCKDLREKIQNGQGGVDNFQVHNGLVCYRPKRAGRRRWVVLASLKQLLFKYFHDAVLSGHLGARKTLQRIATNFWWPRMRAEIFAYVRKCELCQRAKPAQNTRVGLHSADPSSRPMERLFIDFVGPLVRTKRGNMAILVILDGFSKFGTFCPVRKISAQVVTDCLERTFFPAYSTPNSIVTDNARVFCGKQFRDLCFRWGIDHITTTPYYPQSSLAERANRNLKSALKVFHHESQMTWDVDLPWLGIAFNTAVHESTKCTPDVLFLGREMRSPLEVRWDLSPEKTGNNGDTN
jgi:transposase InsO family protein